MAGVYMNGDATETNTLSNKVLIDDEKTLSKEESNDEQVNIIKKDNNTINTEASAEHDISNSSNDDSDDSGILNGSYDLDDKTDISNGNLKDVTAVNDLINQVDKCIDDKNENVKTENETTPNGIVQTSEDKEVSASVDVTSSPEPVVLSEKDVDNVVDSNVDNSVDVNVNNVDIGESSIKSVDDVSLTESYIKISLGDSKEESDDGLDGASTEPVVASTEPVAASIDVVTSEVSSTAEATDSDIKQNDVDIEDEVEIEPAKVEQINGNKEIVNGTKEEEITTEKNEDETDPAVTVESVSNVEASDARRSWTLESSDVDTAKDIPVIDLTEDEDVATSEVPITTAKDVASKVVVTSEVVTLTDDESNGVVVIEKVDDEKSNSVEVTTNMNATSEDSTTDNVITIPESVPVVTDDAVEDKKQDVIIDENINAPTTKPVVAEVDSLTSESVTVEDSTDNPVHIIQEDNTIATETTDESEYNPVGKLDESSVIIDTTNQTSEIDKPIVIETPPTPTKNDEPVKESPVATPVKETPVASPLKETPITTPVKETPKETPQSPTKKEEPTSPVEKPKAATPVQKPVKEKQPVAKTPQSPNKKEEPVEEEWLHILGNGLLKKKIIMKGNGKESRPVKGDVVIVRFEGRIANGTLVDKHQNLKFILGDEDVIQAFDLAVALMEDKEVATIYTDARYAYGVHGRQDTVPKIPQNAHLTYEIEILSIMGGLDIEAMSNEERIIQGDKKRTRGNELYGKEEYSASINAYKRGIKYLDGTDDEDVMNMKIKCLNNLSAAQLKVKAYRMAIQSLDTVLQFEPENVKALFRKGKCLEGLKKEDEAIEFIRKASMLDPSNKSILQELGRLKSKVAVTHQKEKKIYQKMFNPKKEPKLSKEEEDANWSFRLTQAVVGVLGVVAGLLWYKHR